MRPCLSMATVLARAALMASTATGATAQATFDGYLCCNMRSDGAWISDSNYQEGSKTVVPLGTPVKVTGYGRHRVLVQLEGGRSGGHAQAIGNDYSRDLPLETFAHRYVVADDPRQRLANMPPRIRRAVESARVTRGMTRDEVAMAVGYPMSSENPHLNARVWRYWLWTFSPFQVMFDDHGQVLGVDTDEATRARVVLE